MDDGSIRHPWPEDYGPRSEAFRQGYSSCIEWLVDGVQGVSTNPYRQGSALHDAWAYGWEESFRILGVSGSARWALREVRDLTEEGRKRFDLHLARHGDPTVSRENHYRAFVSVINDQLAGHAIARTPPWFWEPSSPEGVEGGCFRYDERHLILAVVG